MAYIRQIIGNKAVRVGDVVWSMCTQDHGFTFFPVGSVVVSVTSGGYGIGLPSFILWTELYAFGSLSACTKACKELGDGNAVSSRLVAHYLGGLEKVGKADKHKAWIIRSWCKDPKLLKKLLPKGT